MRNLTTENGEKTGLNGKEKNEKQCRKVNRKSKSRDEDNKEKIPRKK